LESNDRRIIIIAIVVGIVGLAGIIGFVGQGNVRHVEIFWPEKVQQTVAFKDDDGKVMLVGKVGTGEANNPTLIMRTNFAYVLTVVNEGTTHHRLYIDGLEVQTDLLEPGQNDTITIFPEKEGIYNYYDKRQRLNILGQIKIVTVVPSDEFEGVFRDLI